MKTGRLAFGLAAISALGLCAQTVVRTVEVAEGLASHPVNGGRCLISDGACQYLAFYAADHQATVAKRRLDSDAWEFATLPERVGWDTHNRLVLFQDRDGYLHLTGNMHGAPLRYYRTTNPRDIQSFEAVHRWSGQLEDRVTYPSVIQSRDGSTHMMYRDGGSGDGQRVLVHYDEATRSWNGTGRAFISGRDRRPTCNAYPFGGIVEDATGSWHIAWCWRETPDVETNFDVCYARSRDQGATWERSNGEALALPIRPETAQVVDPIPQRRGLMNGGALVVSEQGIPFIGYTRFDADGRNQLFVATPVAGRWTVIQISDWTVRFWFEGRGTIPEYPPIPRLSLISGDQLEVRYASALINPARGAFTLRSTNDAGWRPERRTGRGDEERQVAPNIRATNIGPLPAGQEHYLTQATARPNRDRRPEDPQPATMIRILEVAR
ncbi:MAG: BNR-4 repeat-containing protein [Verrucomicrobiales bacterium]|nr:BNR-4 repeat-containing protein [Verrucomicrobiales bacterium]MCP5526082.1 BNR-4 repeat-containing protein [Verrucomicrobiales bacterium]